jgi:hypothetical protein
MDETDFEGTLVLEQLPPSERWKTSSTQSTDDVDRATQLVRRANIDASTVATFVRKMEESDREH